MRCKSKKQIQEEKNDAVVAGAVLQRGEVFSESTARNEVSLVETVQCLWMRMRFDV